MPRYFFNLRYEPDKLAVDPEGNDLPDLDAARDYALTAARDLIARTQSYSVRDWFVCSYEIVDEADRPLLMVPFGDTISEKENDG